MQIDIWSDINCPWCYIGKRRFEQALNEHPRRFEIDVIWHSYQLDPSIPRRYEGTEVEYLVKRKGISADQVESMLATVTAQAASVGLNFDFDNLVIANSLSAHKLAHIADRHGRAGKVNEALLSAHFVEGVDTGDVDELVRIGVAAGLSEDTIRSGLEDPEIAASVERDFATARSLGITGVPFFVLDQRLGVSGAQQPEVFTQAIDQAFASATPLVPVGADDAACGPDGCVI